MENSNLNKIFGYIEGYYGNLLDWRSRKKIILKMREFGMNFYFYAPKEDVNHRLEWRKPYKKLWRNKFKNFCAFANSNKIEIIAGISPGLDFNFSSIKTNNSNLSYDFDKLVSKYQVLIEEGADHLALLLDDIPDNFNENFSKHEEGLIHAKLSNLLSEKLNRHIFLVPRIYADEMKKENVTYLDNLFQELYKNTQIFYCGKYIVNNKFESSIKTIIKRKKENKVIFWDNYYANDYCPKKLFLGPWLINDEENKKVMLNLTGMIETDLLLMEVASKCKFSKNKVKIWEQVLKKNQVPEDFMAIYKFFEKPSLTNDKKILKVKVDLNIFDKIDKLLWKWKTPLSREWYPYILCLKQDLQILNDELSFNRILKTQTHPLVKKILKINGV